MTSRQRKEGMNGERDSEKNREKRIKGVERGWREREKVGMLGGMRYSITYKKVHYTCINIDICNTCINSTG